MIIGISKERIEELIAEKSRVNGYHDRQVELSFLYSLLEECEELDPWLPIENIPEEGEFLVYLPEEPSRNKQVAYYDKPLNIIGHRFAFDLTKPTWYKPLPPDPGEKI